MKTCTRCGIERPIADFAARRKERGTLQSWCRACHKVAAAERYARSSPREFSRRRSSERARRAALRQRVWDVLRGSRCADCGEADPLVLDLDHLRDKRGNVSDLVSSGLAWSAIEAEVAKCEVRCGNCHRKQTRQRRSERPTERAERLVTFRRPRERPAVARTAAERRTDTPGLRPCPRCRTQRPLDAFAWRVREQGLRQPWCRYCHNSHKRAFYAANRQTEADRVARRRDAVVAQTLERVRELLKANPCVDCGESDPVVLEFDHVAEKKANVTTMVKGGLVWTSIEREIAKCQIRCVNCHRRRTAVQQGFRDRKIASGQSVIHALRPRTDSNRRLLRP